jgi:hypothetical protein
MDCFNKKDKPQARNLVTEKPVTEKPVTKKPETKANNAIAGK